MGASELTIEIREELVISIPVPLVQEVCFVFFDTTLEVSEEHHHFGLYLNAILDLHSSSICR